MLNSNNPSPQPRHCGPQRQSGIVLMLAIVVLVAMSLAAIGLMRSLLSSNKVAGNLAFQQSALQSANVGIESAIAWLEQNNFGTRLHNNITIAAGEPVGYVAMRQNPAANQNWEQFWTTVLVPSNRVTTLATDAAGNRVSFIIHRLCNATGAPNSGAIGGIGCEFTPFPEGTGNSQGTGGGKTSGVPDAVTYRITARVIGPRNTVGFAQAVVSL